MSLSAVDHLEQLDDLHARLPDFVLMPLILCDLVVVVPQLLEQVFQSLFGY